MKPPTPPRRKPSARPLASLGPIADLERHLPEEWWRQIFHSLYLKTDGDVVENDRITRSEVDLLVQATGITTADDILDLCCGQGRHVLELCRRGFKKVMGVDRSRYLVRLARKRTQDAGFNATVREGDARHVRLPEGSQDCVAMMGNSFGYFASEEDDLKVLRSVARVLRSGGTVALDLTDGEWVKTNFDPRSWEWIDQKHFVCRERSLSSGGDRLITREVVVHDERGVIADQFYAERLYSRERIQQLLESAGFRTVRFHAEIETQSDRNQDLGMMSRRIFMTAAAPRREVKLPARGQPVLNVAVLMGDPRLPDPVKRGGKFNPEDIETINRLRDALAEVPGYRYRYLDNHASLERDLRAERTDLVLNLCDEGFNNDAFMELHIPAMIEMQGLPYTGAGPACLAECYDKSLVRAIASSLEVPVPLETLVRAGDQAANLPSTFPAILKPNYGDSSIGITKDAVVNDSKELLAYLERMREMGLKGTILVQEYLTGGEYSLCLVGNPSQSLRALPILEVDFSGLDPALPRILGYESKWLPDSPYWTQVRYRETSLPPDEQGFLIDYSTRLFERLGCRDYARFDFRAGADGVIKLLEVNPNPGWCWDGKVNLMAGMAGIRYAELLAMILGAARERLGLGSASPMAASHANHDIARSEPRDQGAGATPPAPTR